MRLSAQTIRRYSTEPDLFEKGPLIEPFVESDTTVGGLSYGLSCCGYDVRLREDITLYPLCLKTFVWNFLALDVLPRIGLKGKMKPRLWYSLGSTIETFNIPAHLSFDLKDKSSLARQFISVFNTIAEPAWCGTLTLEIVNNSNRRIHLPAGTPIGQAVFELLDYSTDRPYKGKYNNQPNRPVGTIFDYGDGHTEESATGKEMLL